MKTKLTFRQPVIWPSWAQRHKHKIRYPRIKPTYAKALFLIENSASRLGIKEIIITSNHDLSITGSKGHNNKGPAVAIFFIFKGNKYTLYQDLYFTFKQNLFSIAKVLESYVQIQNQKTKAVLYTDINQVNPHPIQQNLFA